MKRAVVRMGQILMVGLVVAAGAAGWFGVEKYVLADDFGVLPSLGEGLPTTRLDPPDVAWRRFMRTEISPTVDRVLRYDTDAGEFSMEELRSDPAAAPGTAPIQNGIEVREDVGYLRKDGGEWAAIELDAVRSVTEFAFSIGGPHLLTDLVPPAVLPFVVLNDEQEQDGIRTYSMVVDASAFKAARPVDFERWWFRDPDDDELPRTLKIDVRSDGYVVRAETTTADSVTTGTWQDLTGPIRMESPIGAIPTASVPPVDTTVPTPPTNSVPG